MRLLFKLQEATPVVGPHGVSAFRFNDPLDVDVRVFVVLGGVVFLQAGGLFLPLALVTFRGRAQQQQPVGISEARSPSFHRSKWAPEMAAAKFVTGLAVRRLFNIGHWPATAI